MNKIIEPMGNQKLRRPAISNDIILFNNSMTWLSKTSMCRAAGGFIFTEGVAWHPKGFFLFSDTPANKIYRLSINGHIAVYLQNSGFTGTSTIELSDQIGSNGIAIDAQENIFICQHGNHAVAKLTNNKELSVVIDHYNKKPFNSPNDLIIKSDGTIFFTDPPYGLAGQVLHPESLQPWAGIYQINAGGIKLIGTELKYPNGLLFSKDEKYLLVSSNHTDDPGILRYVLNTDNDYCCDGVFMEQHADGMAAGPDGNFYLATDEGVLIVSPTGKRLAQLWLPETPSNLCWGGEHMETLAVAARSAIYFINR